MNKINVCRQSARVQRTRNNRLSRCLPILVLPSIVLTVTGCQTLSNNSQQTVDFEKKRYERAKQFTAEQLRDKAHNVWLDANWLKENNNQFWFERYSADSGQEFVIVDAESRQRSPLFIKDTLNGVLYEKRLIDKPLNWFESPIKSLSFNGVQISFVVADKNIVCETEHASYACSEKSELEKAEQKAPQYSSPDGEFYVTVENYNLRLCRSTGSDCKMLTQDGTEKTPYAVKHPYPESLLDDADFQPQDHLDVDWSADSRYLITYKLHREGVSKLTLTDSTSSDDFNVNTVSYYYPQAGDKALPMAQLVLVDTQAKQASLLDAPKVMQTYYGGAIWGHWHENAYFYHDRRRGNREYFLRKVIADEKKVVSLIRETDPEYIDPWVQTFMPLEKSKRLIWSSQRTGFQHLYLYDAVSGDLINPITQGDFTVRVIRGVDEVNNVLYFEASGRESARDPYLRHLYRVNLDGSDLRLLTPEAFEHSTQVSPDFQYFVDSYSDAETPTESWLRSTETSEKLLKLDQADVAELLAIGWQAPEPFSVIADDGKTSLHGLIYKPSDFDPTKIYPVINDTYTGPHNFFTPKSFYTYDNQRPALAELGFIVIKMDGRGTNKRGRAFHRFSYKNLAAGTDDHVWAIQQLAKKRPYMDINRVGIFGFSAGGYDTMQAMLRHNEFFKAGVSASGNHDFRVDKAGWNEIWMGWPTTEHWEQQSNYTNVERLKGKLLLAHGELDSNVHPSATLRLADKLIEANKDFDLLIMPKMGHVLDNSPYYVEKRWRFFVEHLQPN